MSIPIDPITPASAISRPNPAPKVGLIKRFQARNRRARDRRQFSILEFAFAYWIDFQTYDEAVSTAKDLKRCDNENLGGAFFGLLIFGALFLVPRFVLGLYRYTRIAGWKLQKFWYGDD